MSVIGGIIVFVLGVAAGLGAATGVLILVKRAMSELRKKNRHLEVSAWRDRLDFETDKAYRAGYSRGYRKGRASPMNDVERLAATLEDHNVDSRTGPARKRSED